jgi:hypothetical protein
MRFGLTGDVPPRSRGGQPAGARNTTAVPNQATSPAARGQQPDGHECGSCGAPVLVPDAAFCCRCGEPLRGWCRSCHAAVRGGRFCMECGEPLET